MGHGCSLLQVLDSKVTELTTTSGVGDSLRGVSELPEDTPPATPVVKSSQKFSDAPDLFEGAVERGGRVRCSWNQALVLPGQTIGILCCCCCCSSSHCYCCSSSSASSSSWCYHRYPSYYYYSYNEFSSFSYY